MRTLSILLLVFTSTFSYAQFKAPSKKDAAKFIERTMLVQLDHPSERVLKKLNNNPEAQKRYKKRVQLSNDIIKASVSEYWDLNQNIRYGTQAEIRDVLAKEGDISFAILSTDYGTREMRTAKMIYERSGLLVSLRLADKKNSIFEMMLPSDLLNKNDYKFTLHNISKHVKAAAQGEKVAWDISHNIATLTNKTLYLTKTQLSIKEGEAQERYKNKLEFIAEDDLETRITEGNENTLFCINMLHMTKMIWMSVTVDAATMDVVSLVPSESFQFLLAVPVGQDNIGNNVLLPLTTYRSKQGLDAKYFRYTTSKLAMRMNH